MVGTKRSLGFFLEGKANLIVFRIRQISTVSILLKDDCFAAKVPTLPAAASEGEKSFQTFLYSALLLILPWLPFATGYLGLFFPLIPKPFYDLNGSGNHWPQGRISQKKFLSLLMNIHCYT